MSLTFSLRPLSRKVRIIAIQISNVVARFMKRPPRFSNKKYKPSAARAETKLNAPIMKPQPYSQLSFVRWILYRVKKRASTWSQKDPKVDW